MSFLTVLLASALGSAVGVTGIFLLMGLLAQRLEKKQKAQFLKQQQEFIQKRQEEINRMQRYAEMEG
jgi:Tfp pilus assembly protein PilN